MKKVIAILVAALAFVAVASAQPRALGVRGGWNGSFGGEVSYQHSLGNNFAEFDLGLYGHGFTLAGIYDFVFANAGTVNFYAGPGALVSIFNTDDGGAWAGGLVGQLGFEVETGIPLNISVDWRPTMWLLGGHAFFGWQGFALGLRYRF